MLIFDRTSGRDDPAFEAILLRLKALVADMEAAREGRAEERLHRDAPLLDNWMPAQRPAACLIGHSTGHPLLPGTKRPIVTSDLCLLSSDRQWARTSSRWYRLGVPRQIEGQPTWHH